MKMLLLDYIQEGFNPIQDSFTVCDFQLFIKYYNDYKRSFFILKIPTVSDVVEVYLYLTELD